MVQKVLVSIAENYSSITLSHHRHFVPSLAKIASVLFGTRIKMGFVVGQEGRFTTDSEAQCKCTENCENSVLESKTDHVFLFQPQLWCSGYTVMPGWKTWIRIPTQPRNLLAGWSWARNLHLSWPSLEGYRMDKWEKIIMITALSFFGGEVGWKYLCDKSLKRSGRKHQMFCLPSCSKKNLFI